MSILWEVWCTRCGTGVGGRTELECQTWAHTHPCTPKEEDR